MANLLNFGHPQPSGDVGSLCIIAILNSPFASMNWAKIPCDYPMLRAGLMCKMPAMKQDQGRSFSFLSNMSHKCLYFILKANILKSSFAGINGNNTEAQAPMTYKGIE